MDGETHEPLRQPEPVKGGSDRAFGVVFAVVFTLIGLWPLVHDGGPRWWSLGLAALLLLAAVLWPAILAALNRLWTRFGAVLHRIANPIIMGLVFYLAVTPTALVMRCLGKDPMRRKLDPGAKSYWIERRPPGPDPETMKQQF